MALDVLVVGNSSREHALAWKLAQSPKVGKVYIAPGNGGTRQIGENVPIAAMQLEKLAQFAQQHSIDLTIAGMDDPIAAGIVDVFQSHGLRIFGPSKRAAQIEASKAFSKQLMQEAGVPTAEFAIFTDYKLALKYVREKGAPIVVKASGLALGKGVYVCTALTEAEEVLKKIMVDKIHGDAGNQVVIEEFLDGPEISIHVFSDGKNFVMFPPSQDHKRVGEDDTGPNTGGMGVIAPVPWVTPEMMRLIEDSVVRPALETLAYRGSPFVGVLYPGLKITPKGPKVLEFNARFGAPECEVYMRLLKTDLVDICEACIDGTLNTINVEWNSGAAANIVLASGGYPGEYEKGFVISGMDESETIPDVVVFHAGTSYADGVVKTSGGRVLGVTATGETLKDALRTAYKAADTIQFEGKYLRRDIGAKSLTSRL
jgi:phosphoribosylamine--glycine ligase